MNFTSVEKKSKNVTCSKLSYGSVRTFALARAVSVILCQTQNALLVHLVKCAFLSGTVDIQGCGHHVLSGGVGMPGPCSEGLVQGRDVGDLQEPALPG